MKTTMSKNVARVLKESLDDIRELCGRLEEEGQDTGDFTITINDIQETLAEWKGICLHGIVSTHGESVTCKDCGRQWKTYNAYRNTYEKAIEKAEAGSL